MNKGLTVVKRYCLSITQFYSSISPSMDGYAPAPMLILSLSVLYNKMSWSTPLYLTPSEERIFTLDRLEPFHNDLSMVPIHSLRRGIPQISPFVITIKQHANAAVP
jgi:hypothetical protein